MIAGPMGLGKTTLAGLLMRAQLGSATVTACSAAGTDPARQDPVPGDGPARADRPRLAPTIHHDRTRSARRAAAHLERPAAATSPANPDLLAELADAAGADTVYLDSVKDAAIGLSDDEVGAGYNRARQHLLAAGVQLAEQHHTIKRNANGGAPTTVADIYGSAWITNGTGSIILLAGDPGDPIVGFQHLRRRPTRSVRTSCCTTRTPGRSHRPHGPIWSAWRCAGLAGLTAKVPPRRIFDNHDAPRAPRGEGPPTAQQAGRRRYSARVEGSGRGGGRHPDRVVRDMKSDHAPITFFAKPQVKRSRGFCQNNRLTSDHADHAFYNSQVKRSRTDHAADHAQAITFPTVPLGTGERTPPGGGPTKQPTRPPLGGGLTPSPTNQNRGDHETCITTTARWPRRRVTS